MAPVHSNVASMYKQSKISQSRACIDGDENAALTQTTFRYYFELIMNVSMRDDRDDLEVVC